MKFGGAHASKQDAKVILDGIAYAADSDPKEGINGLVNLHVPSVPRTANMKNV